MLTMSGGWGDCARSDCAAAVLAPHGGGGGSSSISLGS